MTDVWPADHLAAYGFPAEVLHRWRNDGVAAMLPLQQQALQHGALLAGRNVVVLAPTSAGKTFVGELAAVRHWQQGRRSVFLCPTRALACEQFRHLQRRYAPLQARIKLATADHNHDDAAIARGEFDMAVMVYEKFRGFLVSNPGFAYQAGLVVADELQLLGDDERGNVVDLVLTRLAEMAGELQIVGLSAVVKGSDCLAEWLNADLLEASARPVELREGVYCEEDGFFHYRATGDEWLREALPGVEPRRGVKDEPSEAILVRVCAALVRAGENCLVFVPTKVLSRRLCAAICTELDKRGAVRGADGLARCAEELDLVEDSLARRELAASIPWGVAFHNSDLTNELRQRMEQDFSAGNLRVLVATPTLAQGVNLRAENVLQMPVMMGSASSAAPTGAGSRAMRMALTVERYRNQAGRAGRVGGRLAYGRSLFVTAGKAEAHRLARMYIQAPLAPLQNRFGPGSMEHFILDCVSGGRGDCFSALRAALEQTFAWHCGALTAGQEVDDALAEGVRSLLETDLLEETAGNHLRMTGLGEVMASGGYAWQTMRDLVAICREREQRQEGIFELLCRCAFSHDGEHYALPTEGGPARRNVWVTLALSLARDDDWSEYTVRELLMPAGGLSVRGHGCVKMAVLAHGWISELTTLELEETYQCTAGSMAGVAAHLAWLVAGLTACARVNRCDQTVVDELALLSRRLEHGVSARAIDLARANRLALSRDYCHALVREGIDTPAALFGSQPRFLETILPRALVERILSAKGGSADGGTSDEPAGDHAEGEAIAGDDGAGDEAGPTAGRRFDLIIDRSNPGSVVFLGEAVRLSPKPYELLILLAERCGKTVSYREIDEVVWPDEKVEPQQISAHKSILVRELGKATSKADAQQAIVTDPRFGLRLVLTAERVNIFGEWRSSPSPGYGRPAVGGTLRDTWGARHRS